MKVKIFDYEDESDLQKAMNEFLGDLDGEVVDIKYAISSFPSGEEQIYCFSAMIIMKKDFSRLFIYLAPFYNFNIIESI